jgi:hypothetical protein
MFGGQLQCARLGARLPDGVIRAVVSALALVLRDSLQPNNCFSGKRPEGAILQIRRRFSKPPRSLGGRLRGRQENEHIH